MNLGSAQFDRTARPMQLTPVGRLLHEQALQILGRMEDLRAMMKSAVATERRRFTMGFVASTIYARLPELIRAFRAKAPDVELALGLLVLLDLVDFLVLRGAVIVMSGRLSLRVVERQPGDVRRDLLVVVVHREFQVHLGPELREVRADPGQRDVPLEHR